VKLDEKKSKHVSLMYENGFGLAFLNRTLRLVKYLAKLYT
jgi:hypothetical protein